MLLASARTATLVRCAKVLGSLAVIASLCGCEVSRQDHLIEARAALADAAYDDAVSAAEAGLLSGYGCHELASACARHAEELEAAWQEWQGEELTIAQASNESGYSAERLREMVRDGRLPDLRPEGSQGPIRIRRCDMPRRPGANGGGPHCDKPERLPIDAYVESLISRG